MNRQRVLVVGGTGYFGRLLVADLLQNVNCELIVGSRRPFHSDRFQTVVADLRDPASLEKALGGVNVAICAAGPFQELPTTLVELCLSRNIHYIDLADDRGFVQRVRAIAFEKSKNGAAVCTGWSTVSALSGLLAGMGAAGSHSVESMRIWMAPGNYGARQTATIASLMHSVGKPFMVCRNGEWRNVAGWTEPQDFVFPPPINTRRGYLVDVADHELLPHLIPAQTVEFRAGSELGVLNTALSLLRWSVQKGLVKTWVGWSGIFQKTAALFSLFGHDRGALGVEVVGPPRRRLFIVADTAGERMAVMPASVMTGLLLAGAPYQNVVSPLSWLTRGQLIEECSKRGFRLIIEEQ